MAVLVTVICLVLDSNLETHSFTFFQRTSVTRSSPSR
jgi:hypothetical protein